MIVEKKTPGQFHDSLRGRASSDSGKAPSFFPPRWKKRAQGVSTNVIIDFTKIEYIDSTGIGELVGYRQVHEPEPTGWRWSSRPSEVLKLLKLASSTPCSRSTAPRKEAVAAESGATAKAT